MIRGKKMKTSIPIKFVPKGWGFEKWIVNWEEYCGKLLFFNKGKMCSWHVHRLKDEVFYLQSGKMKCRFVPLDDLENASQYEWVVLEKGDVKETFADIEASRRDFGFEPKMTILDPLGRPAGPPNGPFRPAGVDF